ncbi:MAG: hypothetical protein IPG04_02685 [Polyangiaceae bacterium]|nr:hypothetical protein [Polyangiaceae bacterium]
MNKSVLVSALLVAGLVVACGDSGAGGSGGSGGGNGGESAGGTSSDGGSLNVGGFGNGGDPGNGGSTTNNMSTTTGMTGGCDDTGVCQDQDQDPTNDCISCAFAGERVPTSSTRAEWSRTAARPSRTAPAARTACLRPVPDRLRRARLWLPLRAPSS